MASLLAGARSSPAGRQPMIDPSEVHGKRIAMVAWGEKSDGSDDVAVFTGVAEWDGHHLVMRRQPEESSFTLRDEWVGRLKAAEPKIKGMLLGAEYYFSVSVGNVEGSEERSGLEPTGLRWPKDPKAGSSE